MSPRLVLGSQMNPSNPLTCADHDAPCGSDPTGTTDFPDEDEEQEEGFGQHGGRRWVECRSCCGCRTWLWWGQQEHLHPKGCPGPCVHRVNILEMSPSCIQRWKGIPPRTTSHGSCLYWELHSFTLDHPFRTRGDSAAHSFQQTPASTHGCHFQHRLAELETRRVTAPVTWIRSEREVARTSGCQQTPRDSLLNLAWQTPWGALTPAAVPQHRGTYVGMGTPAAAT